jgi:hypothetical protein
MKHQIKIQILALIPLFFASSAGVRRLWALPSAAKQRIRQTRRSAERATNHSSLALAKLAAELRRIRKNCVRQVTSRATTPWRWR